MLQCHQIKKGEKGMILRRKTALKKLESGEIRFRNLPEKFRGDKNVLLVALKNDISAFVDASEELRNDKEVVLKTIKMNFNALPYASERLRNDKDVVLEAVKQNGYALKYASEELQNDKEVVLEAVKQDNHTLRYASEELRNDKEVVLEAVKRNGFAFEDASEELRRDREFVLEAVKQSDRAFKFASKDLKNDEEVISTAMNTAVNTGNFFFNKELKAAYSSQLYKKPELYANLPIWYFRDENAEELAEINSKVGQALKDRVGEKVSEKDELYASNILAMMNETIHKKRQELAKGESQKAEESKKVGQYKDIIDSQIANLGKG